MGAGLQGSLMMGAGGAAMLMPYKMISSAAMESEDNLAKVKTLLVTTMDFTEAGQSLELLRDRIFEIGHDSRIPLGDLEKASYDLISADLSLAEAMGALKPTADLAVAGQGSMQESVETMTTLLNTYGKRWGDTLTPMEKATKIGNTLAGTVAAFKTTLPALSGALTYVGGSANALGVDLSELTSIIGAAQTAGLQETLAGTSLSAFYRQATKLVMENGEEYDGAAISVGEYIDALDRGATVQAKASLAGLKLVDSTGKLLPFYEILGQLEKRFGITTEKMDELAKKGVKGADALAQMGVPAKYLGLLQKRGEGFGAEGSRVITVLLGQSEALKKRIQLIKESNNLDRMLAAQQESLASRLQMTKNRMKEFQITVGDANLARQKGALEWFDDMLEDMTGFAEAHPGLVRTTSDITLVAGGLAGLGVAIRAIGWAGAPLFKIGRGLAFIGAKHPALLAVTAALIEMGALIKGTAEYADIWEQVDKGDIDATMHMMDEFNRIQKRIQAGGVEKLLGWREQTMWGWGQLTGTEHGRAGLKGIVQSLLHSVGLSRAPTPEELWMLPEATQGQYRAKAADRAAGDYVSLPAPEAGQGTVHHHNETITIENTFEVTKDVDADDLKRMVDESQEDARRVAESRIN
jgi:TP901 family phage tail tape measure protein